MIYKMNDPTKENFSRYQMVMEKFHSDSRNIVVDWANEILENKDKYLVVDVKIANRTDKEIIGLTAANLDGIKILDVLVRPQGDIDKYVLSEIKANGINLADLPLWEAKVSELKYLETKILLDENWDYDESAFDNTIAICGSEDLSLQGIDVGKIYSMYRGDWDRYNCKYRWQSIPGKSTTERDRCRDLIAAIESMANEGDIP
jgi:hypothetical protein